MSIHPVMLEGLRWPMRASKPAVRRYGEAQRPYAAAVE
jgi:hypothetical protein